MKNLQSLQTAFAVMVMCITGYKETMAEPRNASICFAHPSNILNLTCSIGSMIRINKIIYGLSASGKCNYTEGDCHVTEDTPYSCVGQSHCGINLPSGDYGRYIPHCKQYSNYIQVEYECIPVDWSVDICDEHKDKLFTQNGYIHSPRYPSNYPSNKDCELHIIVNPGQKIKLLALDLHIQDANGSDCEDTLYIHDNLRGSTLCGSRQNDLIFTTMANELILRFKSGVNNGRRKGLWLYFEAFPPMETTQNPTSIPTTRMPPSARPNPKNDVILTSTSRNQMKVSVKPTTNSKLLSSLLPSFATTELKHSQKFLMQQEEATIPAAAIIGGVLGSLLLILAVLVILLIIKRPTQQTPPEEVYAKLEESSQMPQAYL
ncbi:uncharacterized protein LOC106154093 isoform X3 [Lingula anatina]|uniref:Uncharacterized protein LOC106154093 isoform X3 n=1 Tax=Lingula anatina TaxID=7574 RepID=A0A1S3HE60_LINAN|nr:uncharacterized protein LOC106154093 isoform X3 [Lingula anatina]|eukprot:XP_013383791.1 uncharacterized protein LOC106154093 isoform X3 [Lingula anatina]